MASTNERPDRVLRAIAVFKFVKGAALLAASFGLFKLLHRDVAAALEYWVDALRINPSDRIIVAALRKAGWLTDKRLEELGALSAAYAVVFLTEGTGLWLRKRWAEWFTVIVTGSLIPFEIWELSRKVSALRAALLVGNIAIVVYLIVRLKQNGGAKHGAPSAH